MLPAQQRLAADHLAAAQVDRGLVMQDELAVAQGVDELGLDGELVRHPRVHLGRVEHVARAGRLRLSQRRFRILEQRIGGGTIDGKERDAHAHRHAQVVAVEREALLQRLHDAVVEERPDSSEPATSSGTATANVSALMRASVDAFGSAPRKRSATCVSSMSPACRPQLSFTCVK